MNTMRNDMKKYFYGTMRPLILTLGGIVLGVILMINDSAGIGFMIALISFFAGPLWKQHELTSPDPYAEGKYDEYVKQDMENFKSQALQRLGIIEEEISIAQPISGVGPWFDYVDETPQNNIKTLYQPMGVLKFKLGADSKARYTMLQATIFFFSEEQIYVYQIDYDICSSKIFGDRTFEYFYRDIDCVVTGKRTETVDRKRNTKKEYEYFSVIVTSGTSTKAVSDNEESILENQVMAMRSLIRNKKKEMA